MRCWAFACLPAICSGSLIKVMTPDLVTIIFNPTDFAANSESYLSPLTASGATFELNAVEYVFRIGSPPESLLLSSANPPYSPVQFFPAIIYIES
jgi:hypothetical protein